MLKAQLKCVAHADVLLPVCGIGDVVFPTAFDTWEIQISKMYAINMTFLHFHLPFSGDQCIKSKIQVAELDFSAHVNVTNYYCGRREPWNVYQTKESCVFHVSIKNKHPLPAGYGFILQYQAMDKQSLKSIYQNMILLQYLVPGTAYDKLLTMVIQPVSLHQPSRIEILSFVHVMASAIHHACLQSTQPFAGMIDVHSMTFYN